MRNFSISRTLLLTGFLIALAFNPIAGQQPTEIERDAIRSACRSDFLTNCASVQPGGKEALECLLQNDLKLSASCKSAVNAVGRKPAQPMAEEVGHASARSSSSWNVVKGRSGAGTGRSDQSDKAGLHIERLHGALFLDLAKQSRSDALPESQRRRPLTGLPDCSWIAFDYCYGDRG